MSDTVSGGGVVYRVDLDNAAALAGLTKTSAMLRTTAATGSRDIGMLDAAFSGMARNLNGGVGQSLRQTQAQISALGTAGAGAGSMLTAGLGMFVGGMVVTKAISGIKDVVTTYVDFDKQMRLMWTNLPAMSEKSFKDVEVKADAFATKMAMTGSDVAKALYDVTSVGFDPIKAMLKGGVLDAAATLSIGGDAGLPETTKALITVMNTYGQSQKDVTKDADILQVAVRDGDMTMQDLASTLSNVTPIASQAGVSLEDVGANLSVLTKMGFTAGQSTDNLRMMIDELEKTSSKSGQAFIDATGQTFPEYIKAGHNVGDAVKVLNTHMQEQGKSAVEVFTRIQGAQAFMALSSATGAQQYRIAMGDMAKSAGTAEDAAKKMRNSEDYALKQSAAAWDKFKRDTGASLAPLIKDLAGLSGAIAKVFSQEWVRTGTEIAITGGTAAFAIGKLVTAYKALVSAEMIAGLGKLSTATKGIAAAEGLAAGASAASALPGAAGVASRAAHMLPGGPAWSAGTAAAETAGGAAGASGLMAWLKAGGLKGAAGVVGKAGVVGGIIAGGGMELAALKNMMLPDPDELNNLMRGRAETGMGNGFFQQMGTLGAHTLFGGKADDFTGYNSAVKLGATLNDGGTETQIGIKHAAIAMQKLTDKQKTVDLTKEEQAQVDRLTSMYGDLAQQGNKAAQGIMAQSEAQTTEMKALEQVGNSWRGSFNMFDAAPEMQVGGAKGIAAAEKAVKDAQAAVDKAVKGGKGVPSAAEVASAHAAQLTADNAVLKGQGRGLTGTAMEALTLRATAAQAKYNDVLGKGGANADQTAAAEQKLADAREALKAAKAPTALSIAELTKQSAGQFKYQQQNVNDVTALTAGGLNKVAIANLFDVEKAHPGTLHAVASGNFKAFVGQMNAQADLLDESKSPFARAMAGMPGKAVTEALPQINAAGEKFGTTLTDSIVHSLQDQLGERLKRIMAEQDAMLTGPGNTPYVFGQPYSSTQGSSVTHVTNWNQPNFNAVQDPTLTATQLAATARANANGRG